MFNRRGLIKSLLATPLLSLFKPKAEENIVMAGNENLYEQDLKKGSLEKIQGLNYPPFDKYEGIHCSGTTLMYRGYEIRGSV